MLKLVDRPVLPRRQILDHYKSVLDDAQRALNELNAPTLPGLGSLGKSHDELLPAAMKAAEWEAIHTGPFNWSGKEIYRDPGDYKDPEEIGVP